MRAAGSRPAIPALARMLEISTHHACETGEQTALADPRSPQSIILSSILDGTGRRSHDHSGHQPLSNRHRARCSWVLCLPRLRALQVCRRRPTPGVAAVPHGRHPQTFTIEAGGKDHLEYWIPSEDLAAFNGAIIGQIEVVAEFAK
jgi:hypothetical protein